MKALALRGIAGSRGLLPLRHGWHDVRDWWHYRRRATFVGRDVHRGPWSARAVAAALSERGVCILPHAIDAATLDASRTAVDALLGERSSAAADVPGMSVRSIDFARWSGLAELVLDELILSAVEIYYGRPVYLAVAQAHRLEPVEPWRGDSYQWHHDMKGKYVKAMWLLTDVPRDGQRMTYAAGSHRVKRRGLRYEDSRSTEREARRSGELVECVGPAGSVVLFDTNGLHSGNRNKGPRRDVVFSVFSAGRYLTGCRFDERTLTSLTPGQRAILQRSRAASPRYEGTSEDAP
jgi:ectoine hydroxylase-related dioxygenase (phytanoyl-CoA dioxygenase family)